MKKCDEMMTQSPICCPPNDRGAKETKLMKSEQIIGSIPVIENQQTKKMVSNVAEWLDAKSTMLKGISRSNAK